MVNDTHTRRRRPQRGVVLQPVTAARCGFTSRHRSEAWYYSPSPQRGVVLQPATAERHGITARHRSEVWFYNSLSRRNAFVGDTCTLPSTLLVYIYDNSTTSKKRQIHFNTLVHMPKGTKHFATSYLNVIYSPGGADGM